MSNIDIHEFSRISNKYKSINDSLKSPKIKSTMSEKKVKDILYDSGISFYIPEFQREYTWGVNEITALVDSMLKGIYCSGFTIWKTNEYIVYDEKNHKNFQDYFKDNIKRIAYSDLYCLYNSQYKSQFELEIEKIYNRESSTKSISCIIDGQQRITTLFFLRDGVSGDDKLDYTKFYINIPNFIRYIESKSDLHQQIPLCEYIKSEVDLEHPYNYISVYDVLNKKGNIEKFLDNMKEEFKASCENPEELGDYLDKFYILRENYSNIFTNLKDRMLNFTFTYSEVSNVDYNEILEFFIRQNVAGKKLTNLDITLSCLFSYNLNVQKKLEDIWSTKGMYNHTQFLEFFKGNKFKYKQKSAGIILTSFNLYLTKGMKPDLTIKNIPENLNNYMKNQTEDFSAEEIFDKFMRTLNTYLNILKNDYKVSNIDVLPTDAYFIYIYGLYINSNLKRFEYIKISPKLLKIFIKLGLLGSDNSRVNIFESRLSDLIKIINGGRNLEDIEEALDKYYEENIFLEYNELKRLKEEFMSPKSNQNNKPNNSRIKAYWWFYLIQNPVCCGTWQANRTDSHQDHIFPNSIYNDSSILNYNLLQESENQSKSNKQPNTWFKDKEYLYEKLNGEGSYYKDVIKSNIISREMYDNIVNTDTELSADDLNKFKSERFNLFINLLNLM